MRARNIKPGLFENEILASADAFHVLTFIGLWGLADREGRLEDRPLKIHLQLHVLRGDLADTERSLTWLNEQGFIVRYEVESARYICIPKFSKHQRPHVRETASTLPAFNPEGTTEDQPRHSLVTTEDQPRISQGALIPDSGFGSPLNPENGFSDALIPESGSSDSGMPPAAGADRQPAAASREGQDEIEKAKEVIREPRNSRFNDRDLAALAGVSVAAVKQAKTQIQRSTRRST